MGGAAVIPDVAYAAALLLAGVLGWAGVAKLRRPAATAAAFTDLGLPAPAGLAVAVPAAELAAAALLAVRPPLGGLVAAALLAAFSGLLAARLRAGVHVACACFGSSRTAPVSSVELVRNLMLGVAALAAVAARPALPPVEAIVAVTVTAAAALVVLGLLGLRRDAGVLWRNSERIHP
jgi:hypothetical protein